MARKSKKSKGSKKARAGRKSGAKKSTAKKSGAPAPVSAEPTVAEAEGVEAPTADAPESAPEPIEPSAGKPKASTVEEPKPEELSTEEPEPARKKRKKATRKKAAGQKKKPVEPPAPPPAEEPEPVTISLDDVGDEEAEDVAFSLDDDEPAPLTISLDDDEDDHEARERLIAEALAFVAAEEGGPPVASATTTAGLDEAEAEDVAALEADGEPSEEREGAETRPQLSVDALLALSEMRSQGITLPGELILDLGESISDQDRDRLLAAAMAHAEMQEAIYRIPVATRRDTWIKAGIASVVLFLALVIGIWPPGLLVPEPPPTLTEQDVVTGLRVTLLLQAQQVEAFRVAEERLPSSLDEAGPVFDGIRYVRSGNRLYQLVAYRPDGEPLIFDSASPAPEFQALARTWLPSGADS